MLKLNVNQEKQLNFEMQFEGIQEVEKVSSFLRIEIEGIEYGFPAQVKQESVTVDLPALKTVVAKKLKEGDEVSAKLEVVANNQHLTPWKDTFKLSYPLVVEAKIIDEDSDSTPTFKTKLVTKESEVKEIVKEEKVSPVIMETEAEMTKRIVHKIAEKLKSRSKKIVKEEKVIEPIKEVKKIDIKNITEEDVYNYMTRAGTRKKEVQKLIYEQAEVEAGSSIPVKVLKHVVNVLKK